MTVYVEYHDGGRQESYGVIALTFESGYVVLDGRRIALDRIKRLSTKERS